LILCIESIKTIVKQKTRHPTEQAEGAGVISRRVSSGNFSAPLRHAPTAETRIDESCINTGDFASPKKFGAAAMRDDANAPLAFTPLAGEFTSAKKICALREILR
jgi:hypothetical protein